VEERCSMRGARFSLVMMTILILIILSQPTSTNQEVSEIESIIDLGELPLDLSEETHRVELQITHTSSHDSNPILSADEISTMVVYRSQDILSDGTLGESRIMYQRLRDGIPDGIPIQASVGTRDTEYHDAYNNYIVMSAYLDKDARVGEVSLYDTSTGRYLEIASSVNLGKVGVHGRFVVWFEGDIYQEIVKLYDLAWIDQGLEPVVIWSNEINFDLEISEIDIGDRFVVWSGKEPWISSGGCPWGEIWTYDLEDHVVQEVPVESTFSTSKPRNAGPWIVWETGIEYDDESTEDDDESYPSTIIMFNMDTELPDWIHDSEANLSRPAIHEDTITYQSIGYSGSSTIYIYDIVSRETERVTSYLSDQYCSDVYDDLVAYVDPRSGNEDVYISCPVGEIDVNPNSVYFGAMYMASDLGDMEIPVTITNIGSGPLIIDSASIISPPGGKEVSSLGWTQHQSF
jgi:hypothetical protein